MGRVSYKKYVKQRYPKATSWGMKSGWRIYSKFPFGFILGYGQTARKAWTNALENIKREERGNNG